MRQFALHVLNPMHMYCRLVMVFGAKRARSVCGVYEKLIFNPLLRR